MDSTLRIPRRFLLDLTETLTLLNRAGLDISESLELATEIFASHPQGRVVESLERALAAGDSLSAILASAGAPEIYYSLIGIGEGVGGLGRVLPALYDYLKSNKEMGEKFIGALIYPLFILVVLIVGILLIVTLAAPRMMESLESVAPSEEALGLSLSRMELSVYILGTLFGTTLTISILSFLAYRLSPSLRQRIDAMLLSCPGLGGFILTGEMMKLCFALETLSLAGLLLEEAAESATSVVTNRALKQDLVAAGRMLRTGSSPSTAFAAGAHIPRRFIRWLSIGERTGSAAELFGGLKRYYLREYEKYLERITKLVEPALILCTGALLFLAVFLFVLPLYSWYGGLL